MAKKKLRYSKRKYRKSSKNAATDRHHIFYTRKSWDKGISGKLRRNHYCIVKIPKNTLHQLIHQNVKCVPVPSNAAIEEALKQIEMLDSVGVLHDTDPIEKRLRLLAALFDCIAQPTANALRKQLDAVYRFKEEAL